MAQAVVERKTSRLDLRMTDEQKACIEEAASLCGQSVSQWSIGKLMNSATEDIAANRSMKLSDESFDLFVQALERPVDPVFASFLQGKTQWEQ